MGKDLPSRARERLRRALLRFPPANPTGLLDAQYSMIFSDPNARPSRRLLTLALQSVQQAHAEDLSTISARMTTTPRWTDRWPGEHYHLLAGLVKVMQPRVVVEIGTYQGLSALALRKNLPPGGVVHTFDVIPWREILGQTLREEDFARGQIVQEIADLTREGTFERHRALLESAELIFVDAAKDGVMERVLLDRFETLKFGHDPVIVFDDIRVWNMLCIWKEVRRPKMDLTSYGHWSGTGLIDWNGTPE